MRGSIKLANVFGIQLHIHWTFFLLIGWVFFSYFQLSHNVQEALMGVWFIMALFACVILHELGHALTARKFNIQTRQITLLPIGGVASMERIPNNPSQEFWISIAGPLVNLVIALFLMLYIKLSAATPSLAYIEQLDNSNFIFNLLIANVILALFNLIPAFPMDGGRVLRAWLAVRFDRNKATRIAATVGQVIAILFVLLGIASNIWLALIGIFIYFSAQSEAKYEETKSALSGFLVRDVLIYQFSRLHPKDSLKKAVNLLLNGQEQEFLVAEGAQVKGILSRKDLIHGLKEYGEDSPVEEIMRKTFIKLFPNTKLALGYEKMLKASLKVAPVYEDGELLGMIDTNNIEELLLVNSAIKKHKMAGT